MTQPNGRLPDGTWIALTETERNAIGSNDALQVGDRCLTITGNVGHMDNEIDVCETVTGPNASTWSRKRRHVTQHNYNRGSATAAYIPINSVAEGSASNTLAQGWLPRYDGRLVSASVQSGDNTMGVTTLTLSEGESDTHAADSTADINAADTEFEYAWTAAPYVAGVKLGLLVAPTGVHDDVWVTCEWEIDLLT